MKLRGRWLAPAAALLLLTVLCGVLLVGHALSGVSDHGELPTRWPMTRVGARTHSSPTKPVAPADDAMTQQPTASLEQPPQSGVAMPLLPTLRSQLDAYEQNLPPSMVANFDFQRTPAMPRSSNDTLRPHHVPYSETLRRFPVPVPSSCPSTIRPDAFCVPNLGRDWGQSDVVFPISYSLPEELFATAIPEKTKDCADIVPRVRTSYRFTTEAAYVAEYARSYYCLTFKKGGWDVLRHYEIIAAGCIPFLVDVEYTPVYVLYHLPKQLLLEARDLPGVHFNCSAVRVVIDHAVFPVDRYFALLGALMTHARQYLTTKAMAQYVLNVSGKPQATKVLYLAAGNKKAPLRAQGNYNSWTLFHGLRTLLGSGCVDPFKIPFMYHQSPEAMATMKKSLYGLGFGYAFRLEDRSDVDRSDVLAKIMQKYYDLVIFADPTSLVSSSTKKIKLLHLVQQHYSKREILFLHAPDIAYPQPQTQGYAPAQLYEAGIVLQREIMDCSFYAPPSHDRKAEMMKRCVWYLNRNCFDDVNVQMVMREKGLRDYVWALPERSSGGSK